MNNIELRKGDRIKLDDGNKGTVEYVRLAPPDYVKVHMVSVMLDSDRGYKGVAYGISRVAPFKTLRVRISDNVLEDSDYGEWDLAFDGDGEKVLAIQQVKQGVYSLDGGPNIGWTLNQVDAWLRYDGTGTHPENFHEAKIGDRWESFIEADVLAKEVGRG